MIEEKGGGTLRPHILGKQKELIKAIRYMKDKGRNKKYRIGVKICKRVGCH